MRPLLLLACLAILCAAEDAQLHMVPAGQASSTAKPSAEPAYVTEYRKVMQAMKAKGADMEHCELQSGHNADYDTATKAWERALAAFKKHVDLSEVPQPKRREGQSDATLSAHVKEVSDLNETSLGFQKTKDLGGVASNGFLSLYAKYHNAPWAVYLNSPSTTPDFNPNYRTAAPAP